MTNLQFKSANRPMGLSVVWEKESAGEGKVFLGEQVTGEYVGKDEGVGVNDSTVYRLKLEDGSFVSVWGNIVLDAKFSEGFDGKDIPLGAVVRITYLGKKQGKAGPSKQEGKGYRAFEVEYAIPSPVFKGAGAPTAAPEAPAAPVAASEDESGY